MLIKSDADMVVRNLRGLASAGFQVELDDFGTGHASISNLRRFMVGRIKIDRSFVVGIETSEEQRKLTALDDRHGARARHPTLAEGVETAEAAAALRRLGCEFFQGYVRRRADVAGRNLRAGCATSAAGERRGSGRSPTRLRPTRICLDLWGPRLLNPCQRARPDRSREMDDQNRNLILATALSFLVILVWFLLFPPPPPETAPDAPDRGRAAGTARPRPAAQTAAPQLGAGRAASRATRRSPRTDAGPDRRPRG